MIQLVLALAAIGQSDIADVPNRDLKIGGDEKKRYFLIGPMKKTAKPRLLVVMPGGSGSADFNPFVCRIAKNALPGEFAIAQLVAPVWDKEQSQQFVWPTRINSFPGVKFTTEDFIDAAIADAVKQIGVDAKQVYLFGWSSSGPAIYAYTLGKSKKTRGAFIAMSIFRNDVIPTKPEAKAGRFYILHSKEDFIPISQAESARDKLTEWGAKVKFATYSGGHGWHGDVFGNIRTGVEWLAGE